MLFSGFTRLTPLRPPYSYESWIIYNFLTLCFAYVGGPGQVVTAQEGKSVHPSCIHGTCCLPTLNIDGFFLRGCKQGALQFVILKPIMALATLFLEAGGYYADGEFRADRGYAYLAFMYNICYTVALYALLLFYVAAADLLKPHKPILKFVVVKSVVFLTFWQSLACSFMVNLGILYDGEEARKLQNFLICVEMVLASFGLIFAFPYTTYYAGAPDNFYDAVRHAASVHDVYADIVHQFAGRYGGYVLYSEDTEAAPKRHYIRERMDAAMLAAAMAVKQGAEGMAHVVKEGKLGEVMRDGVLDFTREFKSGVMEVAALTKDGRLGGLVLENVKHIGEATLDGVTKASHGIADGITKLDALARRVKEDGVVPLTRAHGQGGSGDKAARTSAASPFAGIGTYDSFRRHSSDGLSGASMRMRAAAVAAAMAGASGEEGMGSVEMQSVPLDDVDASEAARLIEDAWRGGNQAAGDLGARSSSSNAPSSAAASTGHSSRCHSPPPVLPMPQEGATRSGALSPPRVAVATLPPTAVTDADFDGVNYRYMRPAQARPRVARPSAGAARVAPLFAPEPLAWRGIPMVPLDDETTADAAAAADPSASVVPPPLPPPEFQHQWEEPPAPLPPPPSPAVPAPHHTATVASPLPDAPVAAPPPPPAATPAAVSRRAALLMVATAAAAPEVDDAQEGDLDEDQEQPLSPVGGGSSVASFAGDEFEAPLSAGPPPPSPPPHGEDDNPFE